MMSKAQLIARMAGAMGGRVAEEIIFGDITTGARQDLEYVTEIARRMVCEFGMSKLGAVAFRRQTEHGHEVHGENLATKIDHAVLELTDHAYQVAKRILLSEKSKLIEIAEHLKQVETIDSETLDEMLKGTPPLTVAAAKMQMDNHPSGLIGGLRHRSRELLSIGRGR